MASWLGFSGGSAPMTEEIKESQSAGNRTGNRTSQNHSGMYAEFHRHQAKLKVEMDDAIERLDQRLAHLEERLEQHVSETANVMARVESRRGPIPSEMPVTPTTPAITAPDPVERLATVMSELSARSQKDERRDQQLDSFKKQLHRLEDIEAFVEDIKTGGVVNLSRYHRDLKVIEIERDLCMLKSNFLAIAACESSQEERKQLMQQFKDQQEKLQRTRTEYPDDITAITDQLRQFDRLPKGSSFFIEVDRSGGQKLGMSFDPTGQFLTVRSVLQGGAISLWNKHNFESSVRPGNLIVAVNNARGDADKIDAELRKEQRLKIKVIRPHDDDAAHSSKDNVSF